MAALLVILVLLNREAEARGMLQASSAQAGFLGSGRRSPAAASGRVPAGGIPAPTGERKPKPESSIRTPGQVNGPEASLNYFAGAPLASQRSMMSS